MEGEKKRGMEEEMIGEPLPSLINHCLWNNQRGREGGWMDERERYLLHREINDNGAVRERKRWMLTVELSLLPVLSFFFCIWLLLVRFLSDFLVSSPRFFYLRAPEPITAGGRKIEASSSFSSLDDVDENATISTPGSKYIELSTL